MELFSKLLGNKEQPLVQPNDNAKQIAELTGCECHLVLMQKWLLAVSDVELENWKAGDLCEDDRLDNDDHTDELTELDKKIKSVDKLIAMMKQRTDNSATYKEYQDRSAFTQNRFRKRNAAAIDSYEEAVKYINEHIKAYYIGGKAPKQSELQAMSTELKKEYNALIPEHNAFLRKESAAKQYSRQVRK